MDIHTWCAVPEAELARTSFFFIDDISLQIIEEPPLSISTPLDEYYVGETIPWTAVANATAGEIDVSLLAGSRHVAEVRLPVANGALRGTFETARLKPGIYILRAAGEFGAEARQTAQQQIILAPDPFDWPALAR